MRRVEEGQASGANNAIRELGGVFGVAVLASIFASRGGYESATSFTDGLTAAVWVGAIVVAVAAIAALTIPRRRPTSGVLPRHQDAVRDDAVSIAQPQPVSPAAPLARRGA